MEANTSTFCTLKFCIDAPIFVLIMQKMSLFGAETMILGAFQTFLCIIYHQKTRAPMVLGAFPADACSSRKSRRLSVANAIADKKYY